MIDVGVLLVGYREVASLQPSSYMLGTPPDRRHGIHKSCKAQRRRGLVAWE